jgi:hypothetical protein
MVWMGVGEDDQVNPFRRNPIPLHLVQEFAEMTGMSWIDQNGHVSMDHISVTIVLIRILPQIGIKIFFKFHPVDLLLLLSSRLKSLSFIKRPSGGLSRCVGDCTNK